MNIKQILIIIMMVFSFACQQKGLSDYSEPESTLKTYLVQAQTLRVVADHRYYRRAIDCFTKSEKKWFRKNYKDLDFNPEEGVYDKLYKTKQMAYVFGRAIVPAGPNPDNLDINVVSKDENKAVLKSGNFSEINMVKEGKFWRIEKMFRTPIQPSQAEVTR